MRSERGESLIELLMALSILGVAAVAIVAGLGLSVKTSDIHRKQTTGGAYVRSYAEAIESWVAADQSHYLPCAAAGAYAPAAVGFAAPEGYTVTQDAALRVAANGSASTCTGGGAGADTGVQRLRLRVASADGRGAEELTVFLRRPCASSMAPCS